MENFFKNLNLNKNKLLYIILGIAILSRVALWVYAIYFPISNEVGIGVSPIKAYSSIDMNFYVLHSRLYADILSLFLKGDFNIISTIISNRAYDYSFLTENQNYSLFYPPPLLPLLIHLFKFSDINALPLSIFYLFIGLIWVIGWVFWLHKKNINWFFISIFSLLPIPFWYMLNISTDLIFTIFVSIFIWIYFNDQKVNLLKFFLLSIVIVLAISTRVNGLSILVFCLLMLSSSKLISIKSKLLILIACVFFVFLFWDFFYSYLLNYSKSSSVNNKIFGIYVLEYIEGIYDFFPKVINVALSILTLIFAKIIYLSGLRPSFSDANLFFVFLRASSAFLILPRIIRCFIIGKKSEKLFILCFLLPILMGTAQERYILPILPIFYFHSSIFYSKIISKSYLKIRKMLN